MSSPEMGGRVDEAWFSYSCQHPTLLILSLYQQEPLISMKITLIWIIEPKVTLFRWIRMFKLARTVIHYNFSITFVSYYEVSIWNYNTILSLSNKTFISSCMREISCLPGTFFTNIITGWWLDGVPLLTDRI